MCGRNVGFVAASGTARHVGKIPALHPWSPVAASTDTGTCDVPGAGTCDLPNCHATRLAGSGRRYCCAAHTAAGRNLANERSKAAAIERQTLTDALDGKIRPPEHVGFFTTTAGVVLTGQAVLELRAALGLLRGADAKRAGGLQQPQFLTRLREVRVAAEHAAAAVEKLLPGA